MTIYELAKRLNLSVSTIIVWLGERNIVNTFMLRVIQQSTTQAAQPLIEEALIIAAGDNADASEGEPVAITL
ncbi:MAG: hypothetical protein FWE00_10180 [Defluviitaleaceae bacterium]|nr:hypothetical protein [Defluviitaleaceae bacterium]